MRGVGESNDCDRMRTFGDGVRKDAVLFAIWGRPKISHTKEGKGNDADME